MSSKDKISILTPVHNEEQHLNEMIHSVLSQSFTDWELIVVDDGSTDKTVSIATEAAAQDPRIRVVSGLGKIGKTAAFNKAFQISSGAHIILLGGDDILPQHSLRDRLRVIENVAYSKVCAYFRLITKSNNVKQDGIILPKSGRGNRSGGTFILSRALADEIFPIPEEFVAEDVWLAEMVKIKSELVLESSEVVLQYRIHDGNSNPRSKAFQEMSEQIHRRHHPLRVIADREANLSAEYMETLHSRIRLEKMRYEGNLWGIATAQGVSLVQKLRAAALSKESLFKLRNKFFRAFSGWS